MMMKSAFPLCLILLAGCVSAPVPETPVAHDPVTPEQRVAAIQAAAGDDDRELAVQPLRDPQVEDLREAAQQARTSRNVAAAAEALNQALLLVPEDPAILQERAEVALLQSDYARADTLAQRAFELGSQVGPLCRQHWETVRQVRQHALAVQPPLAARHTPEDAAQHAARAATAQAGVVDAESKRDACTVPVIERM